MQVYDYISKWETHRHALCPFAFGSVPFQCRLKGKANKNANLTNHLGPPPFSKDIICKYIARKNVGGPFSENLGKPKTRAHTQAAS